MESRKTKDTIGPIEVPAEKHYDAQTERSRRNFNIAAEKDKMPMKLIKSLVMVKKCTSRVNHAQGKIPNDHFELIQKACDQVLENDELKSHFPLVIWQTGSGTQTNMNVNEVLASLANQYIHSKVGMMTPIHPNDHINMSQSSNDIFPTAMNVCIVHEYVSSFLPAIQHIRNALENLQAKFANTIKIGRTHMQDAVPMTLGQEFSGYVAQIDMNLESLAHSIKGVCELAVGGTAVGTGLNAPKNFDKNICVELNKILKGNHPNCDLEFIPAANKFAALAGHDRVCLFSGGLASLASALFKMASDICLLSSGPRCGFSEITIPTNEPGSSIMPGKVNPTQCEALTMVCIQVLANCHAVTLASSQGHLELNVFKPLIISNVLHSMELLGDASISFTDKCLAGIEANENKINSYLSGSCMVVTALNPIIGYENAAKIAKHAMAKDISIREAALETKLIDIAEFDKTVDFNNFI